MEPIRVKQLGTDKLGKIVAFAGSDGGTWVLVVFDDGKIAAVYPDKFKVVNDANAAGVQE